MISARALVASSGPFQLQPTTLEVESGELLVLLGPSGAGKTVLLEALLGLRKVHAGAIVIDGREVTRTPPEQRLVAYMPQDVALFPHLSVRDNIEFGRLVRGHPTGLSSDVAHIAASLDIESLLDRASVRSLSGGEAQRVALARALVTHPRVLFLDESFSALDAHIRRRLLLQFRALQKEMKLTAIYVTHSLGEAALVADRIAVLIDGAIVQISHPDRLFRQPRDLRVARFLQLDNLHPAQLHNGSRCRIGPLELEVATIPKIAGTAWLAFPTGDVMLVHPEDKISACNQFSGTVAAIEQRHNHRRIKIAIDGTDPLLIECDLTIRDRLLLGDRLAVGAPVTAHIPSEAIAVFPEIST